MLCWASGNRDPQRFADPDKFDMDRASLNQHLAFGTGVHYLPGRDAGAPGDEVRDQGDRQQRANRSSWRCRRSSST